MGGKFDPSMTNVVLLLSFVVTLSHIPILFADSLQDYREQGIVDWFNPKVTVQIKNNMDGGEHITFHCKSIDKNLGRHTLGPGQFFEWKFRPSIFGAATRFFCNIRWRRYSVDFDAWVSSSESSPCKMCLWDVTKDLIIGPDRYVHWK